MMRLRYIQIVLLVTALAACQTIHPVERDAADGRSFARLSAELAGEEVLVVMNDGRAFEARELQLAADSSSWFDSSDRLVTATSADIASVVRIDRGRGRAQGAGIGTLTGAGAGMLAARLTMVDDPVGYPPLLYVGAGALVGVLPGLILGAMVGERQGAREVYVLQWD